MHTPKLFQFASRSTSKSDAKSGVRNMLAKLIKGFTTCAIGLVLAVAAQAQTTPTIEWRADLDTAKREAQKSGKLILLHFGADWCSPCQQVESYVFSTPKVFRTINASVIPVKVDVDLHPELVKKFNVEGIPADVFITPNEKVVQKMKSPLDAEGYLLTIKDINQLNQTVNNSKDLADNLDKLRRDFEAKHKTPSDSLMGSWDTPAAEKVEAPSGQLQSESDARKAANIAANTSSADFEAGVRQMNGMAPRNLEKATPDSKSSPTSESQNEFLPVASTITPTMDMAVTTTPSVSTKMETLTQNQFAPRSPETLKPESPRNPNTSVTSNPVALGIPQTSAGSTAKIKPLQAEVAPKIALNGDCPVTLLKEGRWAAGDQRWGCVHRGKTYLFASEEKQKLFMTNPDDFSPVLAGFDPVVFHEKGELVEGDRRFGVFMMNKDKQAIVLFSDEESQKKFKANPKSFLETIQVATQRVDAQNKTR
jgi:YHS domain-containing protein/thiol-disulfide isomerase/thioredoxin